MQTAQYKLTDHRGNKRLWIEGKRLLNAGFPKGAKYTAAFHQDFIVISLDPNGERVVSGRKRKGATDWTPIIDISAPEIAASLPGYDRVEIAFDDGALMIGPVSHELQQAA